MIESYFQSLLKAIAASPIVQSSDVAIDRRTMHAALIRRDLYFVDSSRLHFRELIEVRTEIIVRMYSYHYQDADNTLIFRYDDTRHHPDLSTSPHHKHDGSEANVVPAAAPDLFRVLREIQAVYPLIR